MVAAPACLIFTVLVCTIKTNARALIAGRRNQRAARGSSREERNKVIGGGGRQGTVVATTIPIFIVLVSTTKNLKTQEETKGAPY